MKRVAILIPAAGFGTRMRGADKLLQSVDGMPLLRRQALRALTAADHVVVTLRSLDGPRAQAMAGLPLRMVHVPDAELGMANSLRRGVASLPKEISAVAIAPADMPDLTEDDYQSIIAAFRSANHPLIYQGSSAAGVAGHPVLFPEDCFMALKRLSGDRGARDVLKTNAHRVRKVALPGNNALTDLDTPEAWEAWRRTQLADCSPPEI
ncbi:NTP transferase domain-containing protein [Puniceibacterium sp. IMCC21224]|uniref:nucleotidyltransferase family protein n=1 Tax=Puniceibacterium sp. IMCC21224 TaxID=1618204 RepID=UPI00064E0459|nr:nucleotidyltransferase family protein [Puniceibacterium sp. IMCC21224]KMK66562.1 putative MobA-like protein [Puniceibacterium sp. IMCC21224]